MKGEITIVLNQQTVLEAVQAYLDKHLTPPMRLSKFTATASNLAYEPTYTATLTEIVPETLP